METFKITVDARGDSMSPADWCKELQKILNKYYYVVEVEYVGEDESGKR
jgi:hypothetical protein